MESSRFRGISTPPSDTTAYFNSTHSVFQMRGCNSHRSLAVLLASLRDGARHGSIRAAPAQSLSSAGCVVAPGTAAHQSPLPTGFSNQGYWSGLPFPLPGCLPDPGIELTPAGSPALAGGFFTTEAPGSSAL